MYHKYETTGCINENFYTYKVGLGWIREGMKQNLNVGISFIWHTFLSSFCKNYIIAIIEKIKNIDL